MEEVTVGDSSLAHQCLALCQTLASQGRTFSLSLTAGSSFIFSMESNGIAVPAQVVKKKSSPSTLRRNAKRRELFLKRKLASSVEMKAPSEYPPSASTVVCPPQLSSVIRVEGRPFQCDLCTASFDIHQNMPISLILTPFDHFQIRPTFAVTPNLILEPCLMPVVLFETYILHGWSPLFS